MVDVKDRPCVVPSCRPIDRKGEMSWHQKLDLQAFRGSEGTTFFIELLDKTFDVLNSRSCAQKGDKSPLSLSNIDHVASILNDFCSTVVEMTYIEVREYKATGKRTKVEKTLIESDRKRAALGMVLSIKSVIKISKALLVRDCDPFKYVLTYRFCQDPLELFFNTVRGRLGRNNNPTVVEFQNIMKSIWHQNLLKSTNTGNCIAQITDGQVPGGLLPLRRVRKLKQLEMKDIEELDIID
ncbi:DNA transposase THAP9 [Folsomia candida]|uniref:DNA transposase THAP9 n=1 Tax=Folsomia candida TaxID=158441 RepID=A0A226D4Q0_FOLCA|nr:DNA transposase THAP9 [Folsomia candida]